MRSCLTCLVDLVLVVMYWQWASQMVFMGCLHHRHGQVWGWASPCSFRVRAAPPLASPSLFLRLWCLLWMELVMFACPGGDVFL